MSTITRIESGPRMSQAVVYNGIAHLAGQVAKGDGAEVQTRAVLSEIDRLLAAAGTDKSKILTAQIWLADMADFGAMNTAWEAWVDPANTPARWTGEARLAAPEYLVEIIVTAAV